MMDATIETYQAEQKGTADKFLSNLELLETMQRKLQEYDKQISTLATQNSQYEIECIKMDQEIKK